MKTRLLCALPVLLTLAARAQDGSKQLTFEDTMKPMMWVGNVPSLRFAWDGQHVEVPRGKKTLWYDPATQVDSEAQPEPAADEAGVPKTFRARIHEGDLWIEPAREGGGGRGRRMRGMRMGGGGAPGEGAVRLTTDGAAGGAKVEAQCSPDGAYASFVRGGDLYVVSAGDKAQWRVTENGAQQMLNGVLDWVYQEEVYGRGDFQGHWWSKTGGLCAVLALDEQPVREFTIVNHVPEGFLDSERAVTTQVTHYPKAGDPNPFASMFVVDAGNHRVVPVDLSAYPKDVLVVRVEWTPEPQELLITLQDRIQTWAELCAVDPSTGKVSKWLREEPPNPNSWVNRPEPPRFLGDGTFLWLSERTGYAHIYRCKRGGEPYLAVTSGEWQVRSILRIDEALDTVWLEGSREGATGRYVYRTSLSGGLLRLLTLGKGTHDVEISKDGSYLVDTWSAMDMPPRVRVLDGTTGKELREFGRGDVGAGKVYAFAQKERLTVTTRDGFPLDCSVMLPPTHKAGEKHPVYLPTYSGPDAPSVRDAWSHNTYQQFLAQQGFIVLQVNVRSASGRGQEHTAACYRQLGVRELADLEAAVDYVCAERGGDPERVAIEGWSYGGFMTAYALTHSTKFALGLAGAGVYDWRLYDSIYTERYMKTPQENAEGYDRTSVIKAAKDLHGHLVLLHGTMDDNVHLQNTMQLVWELEKAGKQNFELMLYPRSQHGLAREVAGHSRVYQWNRLKRLLDPAWKAE